MALVAAYSEKITTEFVQQIMPRIVHQCVDLLVHHATKLSSIRLILDLNGNPKLLDSLTKTCQCNSVGIKMGNSHKRIISGRR